MDQVVCGVHRGRPADGQLRTEQHSDFVSPFALPVVPTKPYLDPVQLRTNFFYNERGAGLGNPFSPAFAEGEFRRHYRMACMIVGVV